MTGRMLGALLALCAGCLVLAGATDSLKTAQRIPWKSDNGDGTYSNPVLYADYCDPDVIAWGDAFYLVSSSFTSFPGLPVLRSTDLVNWTIVAHALDSLPYPQFRVPNHLNGVWAPSIREHGGEFFIYFGEPDLGIFVLKAARPEGPWGPPILVMAGKGRIDPCPFWDDDGQAYLVHAWAKSRVGFNSILTVCRMTPDGTALLDTGRTVFDGHANHPTIEGPKFYKRNGFYYIFAPAGGVATGWQTVLRSRSIFGPYEDRIVLEQGATPINGPHQGAWVETKSGESWFVHFQALGAYGRVVHLQPMRWAEDWPVMGEDLRNAGRGNPVLRWRKPNVGISSPVAVPQTNDEFDTSVMGLQWQWQANPRSEWYSLTERPGHLRLRGHPERQSVWDMPNLLLQKYPAPSFTATAKFDTLTGGEAGMVLFGSDHSSLRFSRASAGIVLRRVTCRKADKGGAEILEATATAPGFPLYVRADVWDGAQSVLSFSTDGVHFTNVGSTFTGVSEKWVGMRVGLMIRPDETRDSTPTVDVDWFHFE